MHMLVQAGTDSNHLGGKYGKAMRIAEREGEIEILRTLAETRDNISDWRY